MWRLLTHERLTLSRAELESTWCYDDVCEAHDVLDALEDADRRAHARAEARR